MVAHSTIALASAPLVCPGRHALMSAGASSPDNMAALVHPVEQVLKMTSEHQLPAWQFTASGPGKLPQGVTPWVATDAVGRDLVTWEKAGAPRQDKYVAMFYWTWHTMEGFIKSEPVNVESIISKYPEAD